MSLAVLGVRREHGEDRLRAVVEQDLAGLMDVAVTGVCKATHAPCAAAYGERGMTATPLPEVEREVVRGGLPHRTDRAHRPGFAG